MVIFELFASLLTNGFDDAEGICALGAVSIIQQPERRKGEVVVWTSDFVVHNINA